MHERQFQLLAHAICPVVASISYAQCGYEVAAIIEGPECLPFPPALVTGWSLNGHGDVVGDVNCVFANDQSFAWQGGPLVLLPMPPGTTESRACDIGDDGCVVGYLTIDGSGFGHIAYVYNGTQTVTLGVLDGHTSSEANARNSANQIAGWSGNVLVGPSPIAAIWEGGDIVDLTGVLGSPRSRANDINDSGQVVGWRGTSVRTDARAFVLDLSEGQVTDVGVVPGGFTGEARAINNCGDVVARGRLEPDGAFRSFFWCQGKSIDLGLLPGTTECDVFDLNNSGTAVGQCSVPGQQGVALYGRLAR